jgi:hypothetical protein
MSGKATKQLRKKKDSSDVIFNERAAVCQKTAAFPIFEQNLNKKVLDIFIEYF